MSTALGLDAARVVDPAAFTMGGVRARLAVRPANAQELAEALRASTRDGLQIVPWGGGVALGHQAAPARYDVALDLGALDQVVEYQPEDFTLTAECGVTVAALRAKLAARGQELPLEAPHAGRATLGGTLAANASGPRRLRFGAPRDRILGARFALADGTIVRTGGKVVKNVAGYAIHRLLCGSRGGLAILIEASLKLAPAPALRKALVYRVTAAALGEAARWSGFPRLEPAWLSVVGPEAAAALEIGGDGERFTVTLGLEDDPAWVERQEASAVERLGRPATMLEGNDVAMLAQRLADLEESAGARLTFTTAANTPAALAPVLEHPAAARLVFHAPAGRLHLFPEPAAAPGLIERLAEAELALIGARGLGAVAPPVPTQAAILRLRSRIRAALDPRHALALGESWERGEL